ncbi:MAG TPA: SMEK domain-containing protein [Firmicutes bacterium]|nr:SMEK domain-containing protein [Bacillota bacterium]
MAGDVNRSASLTAQIDEKLQRFCRRVSERNREGLLDLTRWGEDIVCGLLNRLYGWELVNLNHRRPGCPAVDLADDGRRLCVQVTSGREASKAAKTVELLQKHFGGAYRFLILFYLRGKPRKPVPPAMGPYHLLAWDMADLMAAVRESTEEVQRNVLALLNKLEDSGLLTDGPAPAEDDLFFTPSFFVQRDVRLKDDFLVCQQEGVRLTANLPRVPSGGLCCRIEFSLRGVKNCGVTLSEQDIRERLFRGHHGPLDKRGFLCGYSLKTNGANLQIGNCRVYADLDTAEQLCGMIDKFQEEYAAGQARLAERWGTDAFSVPMEENGEQPLCRMPGGVWDMLRDYASRYHSLDSVLLNVPWPGNGLQLFSRTASGGGGNRLASLCMKEEAEGCLVSWRRGAADGCADWEGFDGRTKWRADQTLHWLLDQFLPRAAELYRSRYPRRPRLLIARRLSGPPPQEAFTADILRSVRPFWKRRDDEASPERDA